MSRRCVRFGRALLAWLVASWAACTAAQTFPSKPIRVIVPFAAGAVVDLLARSLGGAVHESTGQPFIVEARPGGSSIIGMLACAKAAPDGYTLCITNADSLSFNPALFSRLPYDPEADFSPVINLSWNNGSLVAHAAAPFNTYKEMIAYARARPGTLNWATWGPGSRPDVYLQWIRHREGVDIVAIAYKGGAQGNPAVISGEAHLTYMGIGNALQHRKAGKLKPLVALGDRRSGFLPDLPTLAEEGGDPGLLGYFGAFAPAKTPKPIVDRLNAVLSRAIRTPKVQEFYRAFTLEAVENTPEEFAAFVKSDRENAAKVFRSIGIKPSAAPPS